MILIQCWSNITSKEANIKYKSLSSKYSKSKVIVKHVENLLSMDLKYRLFVFIHFLKWRFMSNFKTVHINDCFILDYKLLYSKKSKMKLNPYIKKAF